MKHFFTMFFILTTLLLNNPLHATEVPAAYEPLISLQLQEKIKNNIHLPDLRFFLQVSAENFSELNARLKSLGLTIAAADHATFHKSDESAALNGLIQGTLANPQTLFAILKNCPEVKRVSENTTKQQTFIDPDEIKNPELEKHLSWLLEHGLIFTLNGLKPVSLIEHPMLSDQSYHEMLAVAASLQWGRSTKALQNYKIEWKILTTEPFSQLEETKSVHILVYNKDALQKVLSDPQNQEFLKQQGFTPENLKIDFIIKKISDLIPQIQTSSYAREILKKRFGLFLGFPLNQAINMASSPLESRAFQHSVCRLALLPPLIIERPTPYERHKDNLEFLARAQKTADRFLELRKQGLTNIKIFNTL